MTDENILSGLKDMILVALSIKFSCGTKEYRQAFQDGLRFAFICNKKNIDYTNYLKELK